LQPGDALHKAIMKTDEECVKKAKREVHNMVYLFIILRFIPKKNSYNFIEIYCK